MGFTKAWRKKARQMELHLAEKPWARNASEQENRCTCFGSKIRIRSLIMTTKFIHTADWQLGKPFGSIDDLQKRVTLQQERIRVIERIAQAAQQHGAQFVVIAGDMFDSPNATKA